MDQELKKTCMQYIFAIGWADGQLDPVEREFLSGLLHRAGLNETTSMEVVVWLDAPPPEPNWSALREQPQIAHSVLKQALLLSMLDMSVSAEEMALLNRLREQLGMEEHQLWRLQAEVERFIAGQQS